MRIINLKILKIFAALAVVYLGATLAHAANIKSGYLDFNGVQVYAVIDLDAGRTTFINDCGTQTLSHEDIKKGATPTNLVPCPKEAGSRPAPQTPPPITEDRRLWGALAAAKWNDKDGVAQVKGVGIRDQSSEQQARDGAMRECRKGNTPNCVFIRSFRECDYLAIGTNKTGGSWWAAGSTPEEALNACRGQGYTCLSEKLIRYCNTPPQ